VPENTVLNSEWQNRLEPVYRLYAAMARGMDPEFGLGGKLLYAGELHEDGCRLVRAANIAGAASLTATADTSALRHANREGVADFLVTSLDEALRILKNEVRKRQGVSVGVSVAPGEMVAEMRERGVLPDLLPPAAFGGSDADGSEFLAYGAQRVDAEPMDDARVFRVWATAPAEFETLVLAALSEDDYANRRWLRLSPRYLWPAARRVRSLACTEDVAAQIDAALAARG
jgi:urocanate hydratase